MRTWRAGGRPRRGTLRTWRAGARACGRGVRPRGRARRLLRSALQIFNKSCSPLFFLEISVSSHLSSSHCHPLCEVTKPAAPSVRRGELPAATIGLLVLGGSGQSVAAQRPQRERRPEIHHTMAVARMPLGDAVHET